MGSASLGPTLSNSKALGENGAQSGPDRAAPGSKHVWLAGRVGAAAHGGRAPRGKAMGSLAGHGLCWTSQESGRTRAGAVSRGDLVGLMSRGPASHPSGLVIFFTSSASRVLWGIVLLQNVVVGYTGANQLACVCPCNNTPSFMHPNSAGPPVLRVPELPEVGHFSWVLSPQGPTGAHWSGGSQVQVLGLWACSARLRCWESGGMAITHTSVFGKLIGPSAVSEDFP